MNIATKSRDAEEAAEGSKRPSFPLLEGARGAKVPCFEMQKNRSQTLIWYNGDTVNCVTMQYMIGGEIYLYDCEKYSPC